LVGGLRAISPLGSNLWSIALEEDYGHSSPTIAADGTVYVTGGSNLWAIYGSSPPQESAWPMFRRGTGHSARSVQCAISSPSVLSNGAAAMTLTMEAGRIYHVEATTDFATWTSLGSFTSSNYLTGFVDYYATNFRHRFYRLATP
jgi:hypothetical protein